MSELNKPNKTKQKKMYHGNWVTIPFLYEKDRQPWTAKGTQVKYTKAVYQLLSNLTCDQFWSQICYQS